MLSGFGSLKNRELPESCELDQEGDLILILLTLETPIQPSSSNLEKNISLTGAESMLCEEVSDG
jgi:hypothetical protein